MPRTYTPTVREVERLVKALREERHSVWWHVNEWYLRAETQLLFHCPRCKSNTHQPSHVHRGKSGKDLRVDGRRIVIHRRHKNANVDKASKGIAWMAEHWSLSHEPMIPQELQIAA